MMIWACQGALWREPVVNPSPILYNKEAQVNVFDHGDISEWNEQEMEIWQLGQIASKIEYDKPLIVISMWTFGGDGVCKMMQIWMNMYLIWKEVDGRKLTTRGISIFNAHCCMQVLYAFVTSKDLF